MRTTISDLCLFNDDLFCTQYIFIFNRKGWAESKLVERQRERERGRETECCYKRVAAWAMNLTIVQIFMTARERIIRDLINMNIKILLKSLGGYFSLGTLTFHLSSKLSICHKTIKRFIALAFGASGGIRTLDQRQ
jgi:hypothetical protein